MIWNNIFKIRSLFRDWALFLTLQISDRLYRTSLPSDEDFSHKVVLEHYLKKYPWHKINLVEPFQMNQ